MGDADDRTPVHPATALSVVLAIPGVVLVVVAVSALFDWRWAALLVGLALCYFSYVASTRAPS